MVFPSVPVYLDPPNWNQQQSHQAGNSSGVEAHQLPPPVPPRLEGSTVRPGSMAVRACLAKVQPPDSALKCPRCDSTNTKFCYFNNYSLSQPRHFCKTCRRYWTRGGALRNVPVGGGCRRNKRSSKSSSRSKSPGNVATDRHACTSSGGGTSAGGGSIPSNMAPPPQLSFMASLHPLADHHYGGANIGLNFGGIQPLDAVDYQVGSSSSAGLEQWSLQQQLQQFPFLAGVEPPAPPSVGLYPFDGEGGLDGATYDGQVHGKPSGCGLITQFASVKMEENPPSLNLPRQYLSVPGNGQYWGGGGSGGGGGGSNSGGGWTNFLGFNSSSNGNIL